MIYYWQYSFGVRLKMEKKDIYKIALRFRRAIIAAKKERKFYHRDRMSNFPGGCCDDSSDLLAYYLLTEYNIPSRQRKGVYYTGDPNDTTNHAWLELDGELFVDITADQFEYFSYLAEGVYVGGNNTFYEHLNRKECYENYDISSNDRLWKDYCIILQYLDR